jgi:hypothetical protein
MLLHSIIKETRNIFPVPKIDEWNPGNKTLLGYFDLGEEALRSFNAFNYRYLGYL